MKTAVEWLVDNYLDLSDEYNNLSLQEIVKQAKELEKKQKDDCAIEFVDWIKTDWSCDERWSKITDSKELLEIYKKEKGL